MNPSNYMTDIFWSEYGTRYNANKFVPQALTSTYSLAGTELQYPLNTLTTEVLPNRGKGGMDSAIAYEWRQRTGDKCGLPIWHIPVPGFMSGYREMMSMSGQQ